MSKKTGFVPNTFNDAGTEETFEGGKEHSFEPGQFENYKAAGLVVDKAEAKAAATDSKGSDSKPST